MSEAVAERRRTWRTLGIVVVLVSAAALSFWYFTRPQPVFVSLARVERGPVVSTVTNTRAGTVDACRRAGLSPALGGQIAVLPVTDGDRVEQGQLLLELWNEDLQAQLRLAQEEAKASESRAEESCVTASVARREADRLMRLREDGLASEEATEQAVGNAQARAAACAAGRDGTRVSAAQIEVAQAALERTRLRAPFAGVIAQINGELGEFVTPSPIGIPTPPTVDLIDSSCLYISAPIDEVDAPLVRPGLDARISLDAFPSRSFAGHVRRVAPYVLDQEKQARTVEIEAEIDETDKSGLLPGYSADVEVVLDSRADTLRVPTSVIVDGDKVLRFDPGTQLLSERQIGAGISNWQFTEVRSGLEAGDRIVSSVDREGVEDGALAAPE